MLSKLKSLTKFNKKDISFIDLSSITDNLNTNPIIENSDIPESEKQYYLEESMKTGSNFTLNYKLLTDYEEDESLLMELAIMAKRSGQIDKLEMDYIYKVGRELKLKEQFIKDLL